MFRYELVLQDGQSEGAVLGAIVRAASAARFSRLRAAFAYASNGGAFELVVALRRALPNFDELEKQWLISFDFGLTDPLAIELLMKLPNSNVRIPNAAQVLANSRLAPRTTFHPKTIILDAGRHGLTPPFSLAAGSGNMTVSGLRTGVEDITVAVWLPGNLAAADRRSLAAAEKMAKRYGRRWSAATPVDRGLLASYASRKPVRRTPEDSNARARELEASRIIPFELATTLQANTRLWIEVENVAANRGPGKPGNQLHMKAGTRAFFGASTVRVPKMTQLASLVIVYGARRSANRHLRYGHNGMDRLDLPIPGTGGPTNYDHSVLMFTRLDSTTYKLQIGTTAQRRLWRQQSALAGNMYSVGQRVWGVLP